MKNNQTIKSILYLLPFGIIIFVIHYLLARAFPETCYAQGIYDAHLFLLLLTVGTILLVKFVFTKTKLKMMGYAFLMASIVKMALAVVFLIPIIKSTVDYKISYVIQFFVLYFLYLFAEVYFIVKQLNEDSTSKDK